MPSTCEVLGLTFVTKQNIESTQVSMNRGLNKQRVERNGGHHDDIAHIVPAFGRKGDRSSSHLWPHKVVLACLDYMPPSLKIRWGVAGEMTQQLRAFVALANDPS